MRVEIKIKNEIEIKDEGSVMLLIDEIKKIIPHRYPFLMVDRILEIEPGVRALGVKNISANEPFFQGHFPGNPVMPGVLIIEALAQTAGIAVAIKDENRGKLGLFASVESIKFKRQVVPGDILMLEADITNFKLGFAKAKVRATVEGDTAAEGEIKIALVAPPPQ